MARYEWRERDEDRREWRREPRDRDDFGQADYSQDYAYDAESRTGYRADERLREEADDYGQADFSDDWAYDRESGRPYRRYSEDDRETRERYRDERYADSDREYRERREPRSWADRAGAFLTGRDVDRGPDERRARRRRGPSDRVLWTVIVQRLKDARGLDLHDVEVIVEDAEVTLNGTVRRKEEKRRIEDIVDVDGVQHVQNNLRVRDRGHWTFL
jgi:hypothetical protein